jgi:hypothetical protein
MMHAMSGSGGGVGPSDSAGGHVATGGGFRFGYAVKQRVKQAHGAQKKHRNKLHEAGKTPAFKGKK